MSGRRGKGLLAPYLHAVDSGRPAELEVAPDIYEQAKRLRQSIDWAQVHIRGDRRPPLDLPDRPTRRVVHSDSWSAR